jgi:hypothetical protein
VGVVEQSAVHAPGSRVWFATSAGMAPGDGSLAERCSVADADVVPRRGRVPDVALAALGLSAVAAWMALTWRGRLRPGERVVVLGGGGAVGPGGGRRGDAARRRPGGGGLPVGGGAGAGARAGADEVVPLAGDVDALAARLAEACGGAPTWSSTPSSARRPPRHRASWHPPAGWSTWAAPPVTRPPSPRGAARPQAEVLGYTNNALTAEQRRRR